MKSVQLRRNITIIFSTIFAVILVYVLYSQVYTKNKEEQMIQTRFRVLDQMGENLKARMDSYKKNANAYRNEVIKSLKTLDTLQKQYSLTLKLKDLEDLKKGPNKENKKFNDSICSIQEIIRTELKQIKDTLNVRQLDQDFLIIELSDKQKTIEGKQKEIQNAIKKYSKVYNDELIFINGKNNEINDQVSLINDSAFYLSLSNDSIIISNSSMVFYLASEFLLKNIQRSDVFAQTLVIADTSVIYCSLNEDLKVTLIDPSLVKQNKKSFFSSAKKSDTLSLPIDGGLKAATIHSNRCYEIILSDGAYKLFLKPVRIDQMDWFIGGLVRKADFQREKQSIAPWFIIVLSLAFLLITLSLPFVKLKVMSKTEHLDKHTIFQVAMSLLLGASFLVFYLFFQAHYSYKINESDKKLKALSDAIAGSLKSEMERVYHVLSINDKLIPDKHLENKNQAINATNILYDTGKWMTGPYPYFDYIFWLDTNGIMVDQISPFSKEEVFQDLSFRDYFKKYDEWYWNFVKPDSVKRGTIKYEVPENTKFRVESIVSVTSGDYKVAFSTKSGLGNRPIVMTGRFYSLIDPIIPNSYSFCIIDESGKVWFHSDKYHNLAENFIEECDDDMHLQGALYSDISTEMTVNYYNNPHRICIRPLKGGWPLYLITMHDLRFEYSYQAQAFITTLVLTAGLFVFLFLQLIFLLILKRIFKRNGADSGNFQVEFTKYRPSKQHDYIYLITIILYALFSCYISIFLMPALMSIISIFLITTVLLTVLFHRLHDYQIKSRAILIYSIVNLLVMLVLLVFLTLTVFRDSPYLIKNNILYYGLFLVFLMPFFVVNIPWIKNYFNKLIEKIDKIDLALFIKIKKYCNQLNTYSDITYSLLIFLLILVFGIMPILKFFSISANLENEINVRYGQLELARSREARNQEFSKYYKRIEDYEKDSIIGERRDDIHKLRMDQGIYTEFWFKTGFEAKLRDSRDLTNESLKLNSLLNPFRPVFKDPLSVDSKYLFLDSSETRSFYWIKYKDQAKNNDSITLKLIYDSPTEDVEHKTIVEDRVIRSKIPETKILLPFQNSRYRFIKASAFLLLIIIILFLVIRLIMITTRRLFGVSFITEEGSPALKEVIEDILNSGSPVLMVNPSGLIGLEQLVQKIKSHFKTNDFNWKNIIANDTVNILLVKDLLQDYQDSEIFGEKLDSLKNWLYGSSKMIILTETDPENVLNFYKEKTESSKPRDPKAEKKSDDLNESYMNSFDRFKALLSYVESVQVPVQYLDKLPDLNNERHESGTDIDKVLKDNKEKKSENLKEFIAHELKINGYLKDYEQRVLTYLDSLEARQVPDRKKKDLITARVIEIAEKYYQALLDTCSPDEKFVLLDLASDTIANIKNKQVIIRLLKRGLLIKDGDDIVVMNDSFRVYLVSRYTKQDKQKLKKEMGAVSGNWAGYRLALFLVIIALFIFIFISKQDFLNNINKMFITLGASIAGISSLFNMAIKKNKE